VQASIRTGPWVYSEDSMKQIVSIAFFFLLSVHAFGQSWQGWWQTPQTRQAHALKLQRDFEALYDQIPSLSPSEERWLKTEYDDTIASNGGHLTDRAVSAMNTRAWSIRVARPHALEIKNELAVLSMPNNRPQETLYWTRIAVLLMDNEFWQAIDDLQQRGVIDKRYVQFLGDFHGPTATLWAQQILKEVVLPYLEHQ